MKGHFGDKAPTHIEKLHLETCARLDKTSQAVRSLRVKVKEQDRELKELRAQLAKANGAGVAATNTAAMLQMQAEQAQLAQARRA